MLKIKRNLLGCFLGLIIVVVSVCVVGNIEDTPHRYFGGDAYTYQYNILVDIYNYIRHAVPICGIFAGVLIFINNIDRRVYDTELYGYDKTGELVEKKKQKEDSNNKKKDEFSPGEKAFIIVGSILALLVFAWAGIIAFT